MEACTSKQWAILKITRCRTGGCCEGLAWRDRGVEHLQYFHWLYYEHQLLQLTRLGCNLQAKATSCFSGRLFFCFVFPLTRLLSNGWTDFHHHQQTSLRCYWLMVLPPWKSVPQFLVDQKVHIMERKFRLHRLRTVAVRKRGGNVGKLKQLV